MEEDDFNANLSEPETKKQRTENDIRYKNIEHKDYQCIKCMQKYIQNYVSKKREPITNTHNFTSVNRNPSHYVSLGDSGQTFELKVENVRISMSKEENYDKTVSEDQKETYLQMNPTGSTDPPNVQNLNPSNLPTDCVIECRDGININFSKYLLSLLSQTFLDMFNECQNLSLDECIIPINFSSKTLIRIINYLISYIKYGKDINLSLEIENTNELLELIYFVDMYDIKIIRTKLLIELPKHKYIVENLLNYEVARAVLFLTQNDYCTFIKKVSTERSRQDYIDATEEISKIRTIEELYLMGLNTPLFIMYILNILYDTKYDIFLKLSSIFIDHYYSMMPHVPYNYTRSSGRAKPTVEEFLILFSNVEKNSEQYQKIKELISSYHDELIC